MKYKARVEELEKENELLKKRLNITPDKETRFLAGRLWKCDECGKDRAPNFYVYLHKGKSICAECRRKY